MYKENADEENKTNEIEAGPRDTFDSLPKKIEARRRAGGFLVSLVLLLAYRL